MQLLDFFQESSNISASVELFKLVPRGKKMMSTDADDSLNEILKCLKSWQEYFI